VEKCGNGLEDLVVTQVGAGFAGPQGNIQESGRRGQRENGRGITAGNQEVSGKMSLVR